MKTILLCCCLFTFAVAASCAAQVPSDRPPSLRDFFESLPRARTLPTWDEFDRVETRIPSEPAAEISSGLPPIIRCISNNNDQVKRYAAGALIAIATRSDSAELLRPYVADLAAYLSSPIGDMQSWVTLVFGLLKPVPPPEVFQQFLEFLARPDRAPEAQVRAASTLLLFRPTDPTVIGLVEQFSSRPLDNDARIGILGAIRNSRANDPRLQQVVIRSLEDPATGVKLAAISALRRMGRTALIKAEPVLRHLAEDTEHPEVSAAARKALAEAAPTP